MLLIDFKKFSDTINIRNRQIKMKKFLILTIIYWWIIY